MWYTDRWQINGSTCPLRGKHRCKSMQSYSSWSSLSYVITFLSWWEWSFPGWPAHIHRAWGLTECFDECENIVNQVLWSPDLNPIKYLWEILEQVLNSALHHQHQKTNWGNIPKDDNVPMSPVQFQRLPGNLFHGALKLFLVAHVSPKPY